MTQQEFIKQVITYLKKYAPQYNIKCYSAVCAQFCLESAYGTSDKVVLKDKNGNIVEWRHNYVGLKYNPKYPKRCPSGIGFFEEGTAEQHTDGSYENINALFWKFSSLENCVKGYLEFLDFSSNYNNLKGVTDPQTYLTLIRQDKYATSLDYVENCMNVVRKLNLTQYDEQPQMEKKEMQITKCYSTVNTTSCDRIPRYIVIHYTAGTNSKKGTALNIAKYFAKTTTKASADFIVDDETIVQYNENPNKRYCWSVGGSKYTNMSTSESGKYYNIVKNSNSISVELCSRKTNTKTLNATDTDWYFTDETIANGINITKYLMDIYNIPIENVVMHHHVTGKICPNPFCVNEKALGLWKSFRAKLGDKTNPTINVSPNTNTSQNKPNTNAQDYALVFDAQYYYRNYADLRIAFGNDKNKLLNHFINYGMKEGRQGIDTFNVRVYQANNADLRKAFGNDLKKYYEHYIKYGYKEGRKTH